MKHNTSLGVKLSMHLVSNAHHTPTPPTHTQNPRLYFPTLRFTFPLFLRFHGSFTLSSNTSNLCLFLPHEEKTQILSPIQLHLRKIKAGGRDCGDLSLITREYLDSVCHCYSTSEVIPLPTIINYLAVTHLPSLYSAFFPSGLYLLFLLEPHFLQVIRN